MYLNTKQIFFVVVVVFFFSYLYLNYLNSIVRYTQKQSSKLPFTQGAFSHFSSSVGLSDSLARTLCVLIQNKITCVVFIGLVFYGHGK